ncbi:MAG: SMI1/KNR4 family protein [Peptococcaceae bacterium]|nr:SMI1/KNR4 family protein [Peptococcaceae bacterium]
MTETSVTEIWEKIASQIKAISPKTHSTLNGPATKEELDSLSQTLNTQLPSTFCEYLFCFNGQNSGSQYGFEDDCPLLGYNYFLPVQRILETWQMMNKLFEDEPPIDWIKENKIKPVIWSPLWIPFTDYEASSRLILDLDPGKNGAYGQVFKYFPGMDYEGESGEGYDVIIASSFEEFSDHTLRRLTAKEFSLKDDVIEFQGTFL